MSVDAERTTAPTTMGDADGPERFVDSLGESVPTYIDPRLDLVTPHLNARRMPRLDYHVPFSKRGIYKPEWLPDSYRERIRGSLRTDLEGYVICGGASKILGTHRSDVIGTRPCNARAVNRAGFCRQHGGALHPADKKVSAQNLATIPEDRIDQLDRVQKVMQGFIDVSELSDEEIIGAFVYNDQGRPIATTKLGDKVHQGITRELFVRMNRFMQMKLPNMLERIASIATSDLVEPETQLKAAIWMSERTMGKTPEVLIHGKTDAPYEGILAQVVSGSRDDHRRGRIGRDTSHDGRNGNELSSGLDIIEGEIVDEESGEGDPDFSEFLDEGSGDSGQDGTGPVVDAGIPDERIETDRGSDTGSLESVSGRIANAKDARDRIKKARQRRFAARANGVALDGSIDQTPWVAEFKPFTEGIVRELDGEKFRTRAYRVKFYAPIHQTEAVLDRIRERQASYEAGDRDVNWRNACLTERNEDGSFPE